MKHLRSKFSYQPICFADEGGMNYFMQITMNNKNNPEYEAMFDDLIQEVFGFSFSPWLEEELWDARYESYSIIENGVMLSNICIFKAEMIVRGEKVNAIQMGAVATRKSKRGNGLSRKLMQHVLDLYHDAPVFLDANPSVAAFYPKFGFKQIQVYSPEIAVEINNNPAQAVKYTLDDEAFTAALESRGCFSNELDCTNTQPIQIFHALMEYADDIYFLPELDVVVIAKQEGGALFIADIIAKHPVPFEELKKYLPFDNVDSVEFGFNPDWLGIVPEWTPADIEEHQFFIKGSWNLPEYFTFPAMSIT